MNGVRSLGYLGVVSARIDEWRRMGGPLLAAAVNERDDGGLDLRLDHRDWRVRVTPGDGDDLAFAGWEVADARQLQSLVEQLRSLGYVFGEASDRERTDRKVQGLFVGVDPDGNRTELFHTAHVSVDLFVSPHQVNFETDLGVGHLVLYCADVEAMLEFYCGGLGLRVTDTIRVADEVIHFLHSNTRHHSLALVEGRDKYALQHLMFEVSSVDEVGKAFDRCNDVGLAQSTIGRHSNDDMFSFYALAPGGYTIEYGYGGRLIDDSVHLGADYTTTSWWGHRDIHKSR